MSDSIDQRVLDLGLVLPAPIQLPPGVSVPLVMVKIVGSRAIVSGHGPQNDDGSIAEPLGQVGDAVSLEEAVVAARKGHQDLAIGNVVGSSIFNIFFVLSNTPSSAFPSACIIFILPFP